MDWMDYRIRRPAEIRHDSEKDYLKDTVVKARRKSASGKSSCESSAVYREANERLVEPA